VQRVHVELLRELVAEHPDRAATERQRARLARRGRQVCAQRRERGSALVRRAEREVLVDRAPALDGHVETAAAQDQVGVGARE
jgi:hypothetical protein